MEAPPQEDTRHPHPRIRRLEALAELLDDRYRIPGTNVRFGMDSMIGLIPGVGDTAMALVSGWIVLEARRLGVPKSLLTQMIANVGIDYMLGLVPLAGDILDVGFKANRRNVNLLLKHIDQKPF